MTLAANLAALARRVVGLSANNLVALDADGKLPPVPGDRLTDVTGVRRRVSNGLYTLTAGGLITWGHGLGAMPTRYWATLVCQVADAGYAVGDEIEASGISDPGTASGCGVLVRATAANVTARVGTGYPGIVLNGSTGAGGHTLVMASWRMRLWAEL